MYGSLTLTDEFMIIDVERTKFFGLVNDGKEQIASLDINSIDELIPERSILNKKYVLKIRSNDFVVFLDFPGHDVLTILKNINDTFNIIKNAKNYKLPSI